MSGWHPEPGSTLTIVQLNRALLARQYLLQPATNDAATVIEHLVGLQSQVPRDPFIGLWTRMADFRTGDLDRMMLDRTAVRHTLMRGTIHLTTANDLHALQPVLKPVIARVVYGSKAYVAGLGSADPEVVAAAGRDLLEAGPLTAKQLGDRLVERFPGSTSNALATFVRMLVPVVQITPRGTWNGSQQATFATAESWLGRPVEPSGTVDDAIRRYLHAFGPATVADIQAWSGLNGLREVVERMRPGLVTYRNERRQELFDVHAGAFASQDQKAAVRFLPGYDNALLAHADRTRIIDDEVRKATWTPNGGPTPVFLVNGRAAGTWKIVESANETQLVLSPLIPMSGGDRDDVQKEGERLLAFLAPETTGTIVFAERKPEPVQSLHP